MRALVLFCNAVGVKPSPFVTEDFVGKARPASPLPWPPWLGDLPFAVTDQKSVTSSLHLPSRHRHSTMLGQRRPNKLWIRWCRRWAQSTVTSQTDGDWCAVCGEDNGTACWEPNSCSCYTWQSYHLQTANQRLHIGNSQIRARYLGKAQAEVQLNSLNCRDPELTWVEPTDALVDAASGEGDAGAPLDHDAKQLRKIAETGNYFFYSVVLHCNSVVLCVRVCVCVCVCVSIDADTENQNFLFTDWRGGWVDPRKY